METVSAGLVDKIFLKCVEDCYEAIMLTDRTGKLRYVNPAWVRAYGFSKAEAIGNTPRMLRSEGQPDQFYLDMWKQILDPAVGFWRGEIVNRAKDGRQVPVLLTITPYREDDIEVSGYMGIAIDLSERKRMEEQILRQDRLASIGMLASGLAHEIGNPLGVIRGRAEIVLNQLKSDEAPAKNLEVIIGQIDRISNLIHSLLRVSRVPESTTMRFVPLQSAVDEVSTLIGESCRIAKIDLKNETADVVVWAEPGLLQQLLLNLLLNSVHAIEERREKSAEVSGENASKPSGGMDWIRITSEASDRTCSVTVKDTGCGISGENLPKIFQPFFTTKSAGKGTGLGLAIVQKLVEEMNGRVSAQSDGVGKGAAFTVEFQTEDIRRNR